VTVRRRLKRIRLKDPVAYSSHLRLKPQKHFPSKLQSFLDVQFVEKHFPVEKKPEQGSTRSTNPVNQTKDTSDRDSLLNEKQSTIDMLREFLDKQHDEADSLRIRLEKSQEQTGKAYSLFANAVSENRQLTKSNATLKERARRLGPGEERSEEQTHDDQKSTPQPRPKKKSLAERIFGRSKS